MVCFSCDNCGEVVKKPKVLNHFSSCRPPFMSCIDCSKNFDRTSVQAHTSCISEAEKYQGALYRGNKKQGGRNPAANGSAKPTPPAASAVEPAPAVAAATTKPSDVNGKTGAKGQKAAAADAKVEPESVDAPPTKSAKKRKAEADDPPASAAVEASEQSVADESAFVFRTELKVGKRTKRLLKKANGTLGIETLVESLKESLLPAFTEELSRFVAAQLERSSGYRVNDGMITTAK